jgi:hypothetical protein
MGAIAAAFQKSSPVCAFAQIYHCRVMSESIHLIAGAGYINPKKKQPSASSAA